MSERPIVLTPSHGVKTIGLSDTLLSHAVVMLKKRRIEKCDNTKLSPLSHLKIVDASLFQYLNLDVFASGIRGGRASYRPDGFNNPTLPTDDLTDVF